MADGFRLAPYRSNSAAELKGTFYFSASRVLLGLPRGNARSRRPIRVSNFASNRSDPAGRPVQVHNCIVRPGAVSSGRVMN